MPAGGHEGIGVRYHVCMEDVAIPTIQLTDEAYTKLSEIIDNHPNPVAGLRLQIADRSDGQLHHLLSLVEEGAQDSFDTEVETVDGITVFLPPHDARYLDGITIHFFDEGNGNMGLEFRNPNPVWHDPREFQLQELFDQHINPQIGGHGGMLSLLGVQDSTAYVKFGGGCVGCGMINVTLRQGIEVAVKEAVPGIEAIVDITDHASGENPFYRPSSHGHSHAGHAH